LTQPCDSYPLRLLQTEGKGLRASDGSISTK
jgi:hypothetical protein